METSDEYIDLVYDFKGSWDQHSKCGLKIIQLAKHTIVVVSELYHENPGDSVTSVAASLAMQICNEYDIEPNTMIYIERCPEMKSKLSFYNEKNYIVKFSCTDKILSNPAYHEIKRDEVKSFIAEKENNNENSPST